MEYRRVGRSGLKVSVLSFGSWVTFGSQVTGGLAEQCLGAAYEAGVNFFDNAETYASGESEKIMGQAIANLGWPRESFVVSSKYFFGVHDYVNMRDTLNRKYLLQAIEGSLERMQLEYLDLVYCHRPDPETPLEETVWVMHDIVSSGRARYWGTSEYSASDIEAIFAIAERHHLRAPIVEQPQYHLLERDRVEKEYLPLYERYGLGLTTWSPLASGALTGKYRGGIPEGSRATVAGHEWLRSSLTNPALNAMVPRLEAIAKDLDCTLAQFAIAWCASNPYVSTVITGASRVEQVHENFRAVDVIARITPQVHAQIDAAMGIA